jgi:hypothetical protein
MPIFARSLRLCEINFAPLRGKNSIFASRGGGGRGNGGTENKNRLSGYL